MPTLPITVPYTFQTATGNIPLSNLDADLTTITDALNGIGNGLTPLTSAIITMLDTNFTLQDDADPTKQAKFQLSGIATATTVTYTLPAGSAGASTLVDLATTQTLNGTKTFSGTFTTSGTTQTLGSGTGAITVNVGTGATLNATTKTINIGTAGVSGSTTNIAIGSAVAGATTTTTMNGNTRINLVSTNAAAPTIASAATIAPTTNIVFVSGTTAIATITPPAPISTTGGQIIIIPTGAFTTNTTGNIALASTAVVNRALIMVYDSTTTKWYPSY